MSSPEDVSDMRAGEYLQPAAAHPRLEAQLEVLPAPDVEPGVVAAQRLEEVPVDGEESPGHGGAGHRLGRVVADIRDHVPVEDQIPIKSSNCHFPNFLRIPGNCY